MPFLPRECLRRIPVNVPDRLIRPVLQQDPDDFHLALGGRVHQGRKALIFIHRVRIRSRFQKKPDGLRKRPRGRKHQGRSAVKIAGVDFGPFPYQQPSEFGVPVKSGQHEQGLPVLIGPVDVETFVQIVLNRWDISLQSRFINHGSILKRWGRRLRGFRAISGSLRFPGATGCNEQ